MVDGNTLTIKMARPFPDMPYWGAFPAMGPIPEGGSNPDELRGCIRWRPDRTRSLQYTPQQSLTLVRNDEWDPATDPGRHAYPDRYVFDFTKTQEQIDATILGDSARAQTTLSDENVLAADYRTAVRLHRVTVGPKPCTHGGWPDNRKITDIKVRQAIG